VKESQLLSILLERPDEYVGQLSLRRISIFFDGYRTAVETDPDPILSGYNKWLQCRLRITQDRHWVAIICFYGQGERDTLDLAREMWVSYLKETSNMPPETNLELRSTFPQKEKPSDMVNYIFRRPAMYLGYPRIEFMQSFMDGFTYAKGDEQPELNDRLYYGFRDWLARRFGFGQSHDWGSIISFVGGHEEKSFKLAKELWQEYLSKDRLS